MDCGASLHMMSKNAFPSETFRKSKEPTVIMAANGKAKSTEEATVHVSDLDVFVTMMLLDDSCVYCAKKWDALVNGKRDFQVQV